MTSEELQKIFADHIVWLKTGGKEGKRANLSGANLEGANLEGASLQGANLEDADLEFADS